MSCELDPTKSFNTDLDPKKTLDYALFGRVVFQLNPAVTHTSMKKLIEELDLLRADDEEKKRPPLEIIIYKDLVPEGWTWERLLPCMGGSVLFEDYFNYLEEYFRQNVADESASLNLHAAATNCILAEEQLTNTLASHAGKVTWDPSLGRKIIDQARQIIASDSVTGSIGAIVPAACFLCITEEAKLMSSLADCIFSAVDPTNEFWQRKFKFCEEVRKAALDILTTYKGPYSRRVAAYLLGMTKEASIVFGLLSGTDVYREEKMHVCEDIRPGLLDLLNVILQHFPCESSINYYPIDRDYPAIRSEHKGLHELEPSKQITSVDGSFPVNSGNLIGAPITSKSSPGTPFSWTPHPTEKGSSLNRPKEVERPVCSHLSQRMTLELKICLIRRLPPIILLLQLHCHTILALQVVKNLARTLRSTRGGALEGPKTVERPVRFHLCHGRMME